jgi:dTDP-4-dehydrorhamnose reductase
MSSQRILLLGKNGQVGRELQRSLAPLGELVALDRHSAPNTGNLGDLDGLRATLRALQPTVIVNAAAHTAVDKAESEPDLARLINATGPGMLAEEAKRLGALLVHYSTDYVFDGSGNTPWKETDRTGPLGVYGQTKLEGEQAIQASGAKHLILRTCWVYAAHGHNFAKTMLRLARERDVLKVVDDQWGAPTGADLIADVTTQALRQLLAGNAAEGLYHLSAAGETTWHGYAKFLIESAKARHPDLPWTVQRIEPVPSSAYPTPARRPLNSRLDCSALQRAFGLTLPSWQQGIEQLLSKGTP